MLIRLRIWTLTLAASVFRPLSVRQTIVMASNSADELRGNLRYIHDELVRRGLGDQVKLLLRRSRGGFLGKLGSLWRGLVAEYYLATSSIFIVDDYYFPIYVARPKEATTVIQTWHASGAFKKVGYSVVGKSFGASEELVRRVEIHSGYNFCLIASQQALPHYMEAFGQPAERFVSPGIPRTDLFFDEEREAQCVEELRARYGLPDDKQIVLYAPTFRGTSTEAAEYVDYLDLELMRERLAETHVLLMRLHPAVAESLEIGVEFEGFAIDVSNHEDINEVLLISDLLLTDYSSAIFDYALLERPMLFFAPDLDTYEDERGFYFEYKTGVPGPVCMTSAEVAARIASADWDLDRVRAFRESSFDIADGHASERFVDELVLPNLDVAHS